MKSFIKKICLLIIIGICFSIETNAQKTFLRLYNSKNQKFEKGYLYRTSDSGLVLTRKGVESAQIKYTEIYKIRMKRSAGLTALIVGGIPITAGLVFFARNEGWDGLAGMVLFMEGLIAGPAAGGLKALINPKPLIINGNKEIWLNHKRLLDQKLQ